MKRKFGVAVLAGVIAVQTMVASCFAQSYYPTKSGKWIKSGNDWTYEADGELCKGFVETAKEQKVYYFDNSGVMKTGWVKYENEWYYLNDSLKTGWVKSGGKWYYLDPESGMMQKGIVEDGGITYITDANGALCVNKWQSVDGAWYCTDSQGAALKDKWKKSGSSWFYLGSDGKMLTGTTAVIDGVSYTFAEDGHWVSDPVVTPTATPAPTATPEPTATATPTPVPYVAQGTFGDNISWTLDDKGELVVSGQGEWKYDGAIGYSLFAEVADLIKSVVITDGVKNIPDYAFPGSYNLVKVEMADSVETIGDTAFHSCNKLSQVDFSNGVKTIKTAAFHSCSSLKNVVLPENIEKLGDAAFFGCGIEEIVFPQNLQYIGYYCFGQTLLKEVSTPSSLSYLGACAFELCPNLEKAYISGNNLKVLPEVFTYCDSLREVVFAPGVIEIDASALFMCNDNTLERVFIPDTAKIKNGSDDWSNIIVPKTTDIYYGGTMSELLTSFNGAEILLSVYDRGEIRAVYVNAAISDDGVWTGSLLLV